jgi:hypothetical protein
VHLFSEWATTLPAGGDAGSGHYGWDKLVCGLVEETELPRPTVFRVVPPDGSPVRLRFRPLYDIGEGYPYFIYFDRDQLPWKLW